MPTSNPQSTPAIKVPESWAFWGWLVEGVARRYGVTVEGLLGRKKTSTLASARRDLMTCLYGSGCSYSEVGRLLARDHVSVIHGVRKELRG
jgi:chromosomal replication initiation ATPase DnaA